MALAQTQVEEGEMFGETLVRAMESTLSRYPRLHYFRRQPFGHYW